MGKTHFGGFFCVISGGEGANAHPKDTLMGVFGFCLCFAKMPLIEARL